MKTAKKGSCEIVVLRRLHTEKNNETFGKLLKMAVQPFELTKKLKQYNL